MTTTEELVTATKRLKISSYGNDKIKIIKACDGTTTLADAKAVFTSGIAYAFEKWGLNRRSKPTPETPVDSYDLVEDSTFEQMLRSQSSDLKSLCLGMSQWINFCIDNTEWLISGGYATFFLFLKDEDGEATPDNLFIARVYINNGGLYLNVDPFTCNHVWLVEYLRRFVFPTTEI